MRIALRIAVVLLAVSVAAVASQTNSRKDSAREVFFDAKSRQTIYAGPGRREPAADVKEVLIGFFGPNEASHGQGSDMYRAATLAIDRANRAGGLDGAPFRLVPGWSENTWQSGAAEVVRMAYTDKVWAIVGGIDGPSTHVAEQVVAKARLTLVSPGSTDRSVNLANVPWMFSSVPGDHLMAPVLARAIASYVGEDPFLLISATDHDSHLSTVELGRSLTKRRLVPHYHFEFRPGQKGYSLLVDKAVQADVRAVVLIAAAEESAQVLCGLREKGFQGLVFGGAAMGSKRFLEKAGERAEGVIFPLLYAPGKEPHGFQEEFACRFGNRPDYLAAHTYDSASLLVAAVRKAGLNRARICDSVRELSPYEGVTGSIRWDSLGSNSRPAALGTVMAGRVICASEPHALDNATPRSSRR